MERREHRKNAKFSAITKEIVLTRSNGLCENPYPCDNRNNGCVDHITSCFIGHLIGMDKSTLRSLENAQTLCTVCDNYKTQILEPLAVSRELRRINGLVR